MSEVPMYGTHKTVKAKFWPCILSKNSQHLLSCSLFARTRQALEVLLGQLRAPLARSLHFGTFSAPSVNYLEGNIAKA